MQALQFLELSIGRFDCHNASGVALQKAEQVINIAQVFFIDLGHIGAAPHFHGDEALGGQYLQRFTQGRAADAVFAGNRQLVDPRARLQFAAENTLAQ